MDDKTRTITDADAEAIATALKRQIMEDFQIEVGKGVLAWFKRALVGLLIILAAYGIAHESGFAFSLSAPNK